MNPENHHILPLFDTHTHDYFSDFDADRNTMLSDDFDSGVKGKIQIGCDIKTSQQAITLAQKNTKIFATVGLHPCHVQSLEQIHTCIQAFEQMIETSPDIICGIGETGFDFFHADSPKLRTLQKESFTQHLNLAQKYNLPLVVHTRNAREETLDFLHTFSSNLPEKKGVIHCFCEDAEFAQQVTQTHGFFLGIGGTATYKKNESIRKAICTTPIQYLVTETDAPYLAPQQHRGKRNQSKYIREIVELIAELKNLPVNECAYTLVHNAKQLFSKTQA